MDIGVNAAEKLDRPRILFVDDDPNFLDASRRLFKRLGYIVTSVDNSSEAINLIKEHHDMFDIIMTDYSISGMNGLELSMEVKKFLVDTPIVLYTGKIDLVDERQIAEAGITEVVRKPIQIKNLDTIIKRILNIDGEVSNE